MKNKEVGEIINLANECFPDSAGAKATMDAESLKEWVDAVLGLLAAGEFPENPAEPPELELAAKLVAFVGREAFGSVYSGELPSWKISNEIKHIKKNPVIERLLSKNKAEEVTAAEMVEWNLNRAGLILLAAMRTAYQGGKVRWREIFRNDPSHTERANEEFLRRLKQEFWELDEIGQAGFVELVTRSSKIYTPLGIERLAEGWLPNEVVNGVRDDYEDAARDVIQPDFSKHSEFKLSLQSLAKMATRD